MQPLQVEKQKSILQTTLEKANWEEIYDEHYGKPDIETELPKKLPKGKELQKTFFNSSNKRYLKWKLKQL